mgnify:FL=1
MSSAQLLTFYARTGVLPTAIHPSLWMELPRYTNSPINVSRKQARPLCPNYFRSQCVVLTCRRDFASPQFFKNTSVIDINQNLTGDDQFALLRGSNRILRQRNQEVSTEIKQEQSESKLNKNGKRTKPPIKAKATRQSARQSEQAEKRAGGSNLKR